MAETEILDREKILELTFEEVNNLIKRQRTELQNQRETALRTLRVTIVLVGVLITFSYQFSGVIQSFISRPVQPTLTDILGVLLVGLAVAFLSLSPILLIFSLKEAQFSRSIDPWDLKSLSTGTLDARINDEVYHPSHKTDDWYLFMIHAYAEKAEENRSIINNSGRYLQFGHLFLALTPVFFIIGVWIYIF